MCFWSPGVSRLPRPTDQWHHVRPNAVAVPDVHQVGRRQLVRLVLLCSTALADVLLYFQPPWLVIRRFEPLTAERFSLRNDLLTSVIPPSSKTWNSFFFDKKRNVVVELYLLFRRQSCWFGCNHFQLLLLPIDLSLEFTEFRLHLALLFLALQLLSHLLLVTLFLDIPFSLVQRRPPS